MSAEFFILPILPAFLGTPLASALIYACPANRYRITKSLHLFSANSRNSERHDAGTRNQSGLSGSDHSTRNNRKRSRFVDAVP